MTVEDKQRLAYILNEAMDLSDDYHAQLTNTEASAQWNLPDELGESWIAIRDMGIVDALNNSYILPQEAVDTTNRIVDRIHAAFQLPDDEQTQVYTHAAMEDHVFWKMQRQDAQTLTSILQGTRNSMNI